MRVKLWTVLYLAVGAGALASYFLIKDYLQYTHVTSIIVSNLTLNLLIVTVAWGAGEPFLYRHVFHRKQPFLAWMFTTLVGFILIILLLTVTGTHTRITDLFNSLGR